MRLLVFDTETTGLPKSRYISPDTLHQWPHIVQFSFAVYDTSLNDIINSKDYIIKLPQDILIPNESTKIHGITNETSRQNGVYINDVLNDFFINLRNVDRLIGHNIEFDINMVKVELLRIINSVNPEISHTYKHDLHFITNFKNISCTLKDTISFCNIQSIDKFGRPYLKYPKLTELHEKLFDRSPINLHNSFNDILVTLRCFMKFNHDIDLIDNCQTFKKHSGLIGLV